MTKRPYPELYQMFAGYLHQDWIHEYIWDEGEKPHFEAPIKAYVEDCQEFPEDIYKAISELQALIAKDYWEEYLEEKMFDELGIYVVPETWGLTYHEFLKAVLRLLKNEADNIARRQLY